MNINNLYVSLVHAQSSMVCLCPNDKSSLQKQMERMIMEIEVVLCDARKDGCDSTNEALDYFDEVRRQVREL